jgi:hypothetical protein
VEDIQSLINYFGLTLSVLAIMLLVFVFILSLLDFNLSFGFGLVIWIGLICCLHFFKPDLSDIAIKYILLYGGAIFAGVLFAAPIVGLYRIMTFFELIGKKLRG